MSYDYDATSTSDPFHGEGLMTIIWNMESNIQLSHIISIVFHTIFDVEREVSLRNIRNSRIKADHFYFYGSLS